MAEDETGILIEARNGPVIAFDGSGLRLRLSDSVIADIAARLPQTATARQPVSATVLGDIDAWSVERIGDHYAFDAKLPAYATPRRFRRAVDGTGIFAEPPGVLTGLFSIGGHRAAAHLPLALAHPAHVVAADDDIGTVGMGGQGDAPATARLHPARATTLDAATADALVGLRAAAGRALPLIVTRTETDGSASAGALATGAAMGNLARAVANLVAAAEALGVRASIPAIGLDIAADAVLDDTPAHIDGIYRVMDAVAGIFARHGLHRPAFLLEACETGARAADHAHLSLFPNGHRLIVTAPGRVAARDRFGRLTAPGMARLAAIRAQVLHTLRDGGAWSPPRLLLAERQGPDRVRVTCDGGPLTLGPGDTGLRITSHGQPVPIAAAAIAVDDPRALDLTVPDLPPQATLSYGTDALGALRDDWSAPGPDGAPLHRHALPARLEIR